MKYGLTLSGGGANGAWHVGALECLHDRGYDYFDAVSGVSVGALIGANANNIGVLRKMWDDLTGCPEKVFIPYFTDYENNFSLWRTLKNIGKILRGEVASLVNNEPLKEVIDFFVRESALPPNFFVGITSLNDGEYYSLDINHLKNFEALKAAILASTAMPPFFNSIKEIELKQGVLKNCADGGLRTVSDIQTIDRYINTTPDQYCVFIINCRNEELLDYKGGNIINHVIRADEIKQAEIFKNDSFNRHNGDYETVIIEPEKGDFMSSKYDFSIASMSYMRAAGYKAAQLALDKYENGWQ